MESEVSPAGMMTDRAVAEADFMTLVPERVAVRFSLSVGIWCRALRKTRSLPTRGPNVSGMCRGTVGVAAAASAGRRSLSEMQENIKQMNMNVRHHWAGLWHPVIDTQFLWFLWKPNHLQDVPLMPKSWTPPVQSQQACWHPLVTIPWFWWVFGACACHHLPLVEKRSGACPWAPRNADVLPEDWSQIQ